MKKSDVYQLLGETRQAMAPHYGSAFRERMQELGLEGLEWYVLAVSNDFAPETTSVERFAEFTVYTHQSVIEDTFNSLVKRGWLEMAGEDEYRISDEGNKVLESLLEPFHREVSEVDLGPAEDTARVIELLARLIDASLAAPEPPEKPNLIYNRNSDLGPDGPPQLRFLQFTADFGSFRDGDVHIPAWQRTGISGPAMEVYTLVWRNEANTAEAVLEQRPNRGYTVADYAAAFDELAARGWVEPVPGTEGEYRVTDEGHTVRQAIEDETDRLFYAPWDALSDSELEELSTLLTRMRDHLQATQPAVAEGA